ncbi:MAG TPA: FAD-dependent oxidoreductase [Patescibacteria group bacterium]|nr:FAD-dependent oxidoreductase [Patescibacteria group bacterium]
MIDITLERTHQENSHIRTFWFKPAQNISYTAGQFIELYIPHDHPDERGIKHWFTLSSSPTDKLISITTKFAEQKSSTFKKHLFAFRPGKKLQIVEPMGDFVLPKDKSIPLLFIAGGIGLTPFHSMVKWLSDTGEKRQIQVLLAANKPEDFVFVDLFKDYGAEVIQIVAEPDGSWTGETGKLSAEKILELTGEPGSKRIYVSGPEPMVEALEEDLQKHGVKKSQLIFDYFPGYTSDLK